MVTSESTEEHTVYYNVVSHGYFEAVHRPLRVGRVFDSRDTSGSPPVLVVTETLARQSWPTEMAVGQLVTLKGEALPRTVVGVVADPAGGYEPLDMAYLPYSQAHPAATVPVFLHVEPMGEAAAGAIADDVEETLRRVLPNIAIPGVRTVAGQFASATRLEAILVGLASGFGGVALLLTATGVFGSVSYAASRRRREWAIRSALGAGPRAVVWHAVRDGVWAAGLGGLTGAAAAFVALRAVRGRFGISSDEGMASVLAIGIVLVTVIVAIAMPAVRAAQTRSSELLKDV
jgi:ABC-type antimicrobial peptide transport system permease subunit